MSDLSEQVRAGQAIYTPRTLAVYDFIVLGLSNQLIWRCPTTHLLNHYNKHVSANHLDVGVGSGFFPDHCQFPSETPRLGLLDLNDDALSFASSRVSRFAPEIYLGNVLEPLVMHCDRFDSISLNYVLHCLPGTMETKAIVFDHLAEQLNPGGVIFGATLLGNRVRQSWAAKRLMRFYSKRGVFSNHGDSPDELREALGARFEAIELEVVGCAALFSVVK